MAAASSPATDEAYGVRRVCAAWGMPRSSFYAARTVSEASPPSRRRGPRPAVDEAGLLEAIRRDLDRSPFSGEGRTVPRLRRRSTRMADSVVTAGACPPLFSLVRHSGH